MKSLRRKRRNNVKWYRVTYTCTLSVDVIADDEEQAKYFAEYTDEVIDLSRSASASNIDVSSVEYIGEEEGTS
jgi:hypothetical protein